MWCCCRSKKKSRMECVKPVEFVYNTFKPENEVQVDVPVIFLHGVTASKEYWKDIPQTVADSTRRLVYAVDSRNHGECEWTDEFSFDLNVVDLLHFMDTKDIEKAILIGHSMGGITAMKTALKVPDRVEKLVVEDMTIGKISEDLLNMIVSFLSLAQEASEKIPSDISMEEAKSFIVDYIFNAIPDNIKPHIKSEDNDHRIHLKQNPDGTFCFRTNLKAIEEALKHVETLSEEPEGVYEGPSFFIYGMKSPFQVYEDKDLLLGFFTKAQFLGIEDANHVLHAQFPEEFTKAVLKFLNE